MPKSAPRAALSALAARSGQSAAEEDPVVARIVGPVRLDEPSPQVVVEVLGHRLVGVEPDLVVASGTGEGVRQAEEGGAGAGSLTLGVDGHVVDEEVVGLRPSDEHADDGGVDDAHVHDAAIDQGRVVVEHRRWPRRHPFEVGRVGPAHDRLDLGTIRGASEPKIEGGRRHPPTVPTPTRATLR